MDPADREADTAWAGTILPVWEDAAADDDEAGQGEAWEMRRALGVDSLYGFHIMEPGGDSWDAELPVTADALGDEEDDRADSFPCISDHRYNGCLGLACPLETCWTGTATVSFARRQRESSRISGALYLPGAPCHTCAHLSEDEIAVPRPRRGRSGRRSLRPDQEADGNGPSSNGRTADQAAGVAGPGSNGQPADHEAGGEVSCGNDRAPDQGAGVEGPARLRRIACSEGLWAHPISLSAFLARRIPMLNQDDPARCPAYERRCEPHPDVEAHLRQRRERTRRRRAHERQEPGE